LSGSQASEPNRVFEYHTLLHRIRPSRERPTRTDRHHQLPAAP